MTNSLTQDQGINELTAEALEARAARANAVQVPEVMRNPLRPTEQISDTETPSEELTTEQEGADEPLFVRPHSPDELLFPVYFGLGDNVPDEDEVSLADFFHHVHELDATHMAIARWAAVNEAFEWDDTYVPPSPYDEGGMEFYEGIPPEYWERLASAKSAGHAEWLRERIKEELKLEEQLASFGTGGLISRIVLNVLDPVGLLLAVGSGGLAVAPKATRLANMIRAGSAGAASNMALEAALVAGTPTRDTYDIALAGVAGLGFGLFGAGLTKTERQIGQNIVRKLEKEIMREEAIDTFGADSVGAARAGVVEPLRDYADSRAGGWDVSTVGGANSEAQGLGKVVDAVAKYTRFDIAKTLRGSDSPIARRLGLLVEDPVGAAKESGKTRQIGASEEARRLIGVLQGSFYRAVLNPYREWAKAQGHHYWKAQTSRKVRREFMRQVGRYVRGEQINDIHVQKAGERIRGILNEIRLLARKAGVEGFEDLEANPNYLPRIFNHDAVRSANRRFRTETIDEVFAQAILRELPDLDIEAARKIGRGYHRRIRLLGAGVDVSGLHGIRLSDEDYIRSLLEDLRMDGLDSDGIEYVVQQLKKSVESRTEGGRIRYGKTRLQLDETYTVKLKDQETGEIVDFRIGELFEEDVEMLMANYTRTMSGVIAMADKAGIRSERDFKKLIRDLESEAYDGERMNRNPKVVKAEVESAQAVYDFLVGRSLERDPSSTYAQTLRVLRDINFARLMGQVGWAQIADLGNLFARGYFRTALAHLPELRKMFKRAADGRLEDEFARDLEELTGIGTDFLRNNVFTAFDELGEGTGTSGFMNAVEHSLRLANRGTTMLSGMAIVNTASQRLAAKAITQSFVNMAHGGRAIPANRLRDMGLSEAMTKRVLDGLKKHAYTKPSAWGGKYKVRKVDFDKWAAEDLDARDALIEAIHRETKRVIQENDIGATHRYMHGTLGKTILQFRNFVLVAHTKQMLHGMNQRDTTALTAAGLSMIFAGMSWVAQQSLNSGHLTAKERRELFSVENIAAAAFSRSTYAALVPGAYDTFAHYLFGADPTFDYRTTNLASEWLLGIPTVDLGIKMLGNASSLSQMLLNPDYKFTQKDYNNLRRSIIFNNLMGMNQILNLVGEEVPAR